MARNNPVDMQAWEDIPSRLGQGGGGDGGSAFAGDAPPSRSVQIFPPWLYPPAESRDFYEQVNNIALPPAVGVTSPAGLVTKVPAGWAAVLRFVTIFIDAPTTDLDVLFALKRNSGVVPGFDRMQSFPRTANNISLTFEGIVKFAQGDQISIDINNRTGFAWTVAVAYGGWMWPTRSASRQTGGLY